MRFSIAGWHILEGHYRAGKGWWALVCDLENQTGVGKSRCSLHATQLSITRGKHNVYDSKPVNSQLLHWTPLPVGLDRVAEEGSERPRLIAVFKSISKERQINFHAGAVTTYLHQGMESYPATPRPGTLEIRLPMPDGRYADLIPRISIPKEKSEEVSSRPEIDTFELRFGEQRQQLRGYRFTESGEIDELDRMQYLLWAGDLDGDGKPDLILSHSNADSDVSLYLSSLAEEGELVGKAGAFEFSDPESPGC